MKNSDEWIEWTCPFCGVSMDDPAKIKATTCANGHTVYLGTPLRSGVRRAYKTQAERRKDQADQKSIHRLFSEAFKGNNTYESH